MITIFNPTNESFKMMYAGIEILMVPEEKKTVDDAMAGHLLKHFAARGLSQLLYGDNEQIVGDQGKTRNYDFKKEQINRYNIMNENRKMQGMGYLPPTQEIKKYSIELGIKLLEPYTMKDEEKSEISRIGKENAEMNKKIMALMEQMGEMTSILAKLVQMKAEPKEGREGAKR